MTTATATPTGATNTATPPGYMLNSQGHLVPESLVADIDKLRDQTVQNIVSQARNINAVLATFKRVAFSDIAVYVETSVEQYGVKLRGEKGNTTLYSYDGRYKVVRAVQENVKFDERLKAAKALIDECITDWSNGARDEIKVLVNDAFKVDKEGDVNTNRVLGLRRLKIQDERWERAMRAIGDSFTVVGSRTYVRVYERVGDTNEYRAIALNVAGV